jgi:hypothetical protein
MSSHVVELQPYNLALGMQFVAIWVMAIFGFVVFFSVRAQYRLMNTYDAIHSLNPSKEKRIRILLNHIKRLMFSILGYQGEERERQALDEIDASWIVSNSGKIFLRFCIFYFVYIWALILTTRALLIEPSGQIQVISYTSKQLFGFSMIALYIASNSIFDISSIYFAARSLDDFAREPNARNGAINLSKALFYSCLCFIGSQLVSNLIWPLKTNIDIPIGERLFSPAIALWPYAFIVDATSSSPQYLPPIFPGQLLITGTVFLPMLIVVFLFVFLSVSIYVVGLLKSFLLKHDLADFGVVIATSPDRAPAVQFRCINGFTVGVTASLLATVIYEVTKHTLGR